MNMGASTTLQYEKEESKCIARLRDGGIHARLLDRLMASRAPILEVGVKRE